MSTKQAAAGIAAPDGQGKRWSAMSVSALVLMILFQVPLGGYLSPGTSLGAQMGREGVFWALTVLLLGYVLLFERRPLASVGWRRPSWKTLVFGLVGAVIMVSGMAFIYLVLYPAMGLSPQEGALSAVLSLPVWFRLLLVLRAAIFEELFYRGFMIERLTQMTGRRWLAGTISCLVFTFAHLDYWGWAHLLVAGFGGIVLTGLYLIRRDLGCNMLAHLVTDVIGFLA